MQADRKPARFSGASGAAQSIEFNIEKWTCAHWIWDDFEATLVGSPATERKAVRRFIAVLAMVVPLAIGAAAIPAHANPASQKNSSVQESTPVTQSLDGTWSCSVPSGYTWDWVQVSNSCGSLRYQYRLRTPVNGRWVCSIPLGWTYDAIQPTNMCGSSPYYYRLLG